jgi:O-acetylhomoserine/O-acetylserine sulfhydrylase-like pyridoxal-dependent enzyme
MIIRTSIATGLAAILLSTAALADSTTTTTTPKQKPTEQSQKLADRCTALETQFDQAITTHGNAAKVAAAKTLRTKGATLCNSNKQASGIKNLQQALKDLGVKPSA